jgi:hypothetical protein
MSFIFDIITVIYMLHCTVYLINYYNNFRKSIKSSYGRQRPLDAIYCGSDDQIPNAS